MTTACDKNHLVKNSSDLSSWKQNNNFWHSSSFSPYQQPLYLSVSSKSVLPYFTHTVRDRTHFATLRAQSQQDILHYCLIIWPPNVPTIYRKSSANRHDQWPSVMSPFQSLSSLCWCAWWCAFWHCLFFKQNGVPNIGVWLKFWHCYHFVAYILPLQATDAYILPMCRQCLYIPGWFPNLPIVTQSCVFSQSRQIHPGQPASHVMVPLSRVTCHVSYENCDSSNFKWFLWHVACVCVTHLSRVVLITGMQCVPQRGSQEDNEIDQYVSESVGFLSMTGQVHGHNITIHSPRGAINCCPLHSRLSRVKRVLIDVWGMM